jgi:hypothetical protein
MRIPQHLKPLLLVAIGLLLVLAVESVASACPTCKDTLAANDPNRENLVRGYFYSILFMLSMPFLIFTSLCGYFYYEVCKARRLKRKAAPLPSLQPAANASRLAHQR